MGTPRLPIDGERRGKLSFGAAPALLRETTWPVHKRYWLEEREGWEQRGGWDGERKESLPEFWTGPYPYLAFEDYEFKEHYEITVRFPKGVYICWSAKEAKRYNPITDTPDIFLKFAALGKTGEPDTARILEFVNRYGILKLREDAHYGKEAVGFRRAYPLSAFAAYAREAYLILRLYTALVEKDDKEARLWLARYTQTLPEGIWCFEEAVEWRHFLSWWWPRLPASLKEKVLAEGKFQPWRLAQLDKEYAAKTIVEKSQENPNWYAGGVDLGCLVSDPSLLANFDWFKEVVDVGEGFWPLFFEKAPSQAVFEAAAILISNTVSRRIGTNMWFSMSPVFPEENKRQRYAFRLDWGTPSLLQVMWLLFALKVTGQLEQEYRICPVCERPIPNPRRNQVYHDRCRQVHHNRLKRAVQSLWREGRTVEEIVEETGATLAQVWRWTGQKEG